MRSSQNHTTPAPQSTEEEACLQAMQLCSYSVLPMTLKAAIELDLFEIIKKAGPNSYLSPLEIASQLPTENPQAPVMIDRIMRLLASYNVLTCKLETNEKGKVVRKYGAAPVVQFLSKDEDGVSFAALGLVTQDKVVMESWYHLKDAVLDGGIPFDKAYGMARFEYHSIDPRFNNVFNEAMRHHSTIITKNILETYKGFADIKTLVDVGGGVGGTINMIIKKHPHLKGINFDLPHVISAAELIPGVEHVGGDMFESVPCGDAIFMKSIMHNWGDEHCTKLLKNCYKALPDNGKVILLEIILPMYPEPTSTAQTMIHWDLIMLAHFHGGKERTLEEIDALAMNTGFKCTKVVCRYSTFSIIEVHKCHILQHERVTNHESLRHLSVPLLEASKNMTCLIDASSITMLPVEEKTKKMETCTSGAQCARVQEKEVSYKEPELPDASILYK